MLTAIFNLAWKESLGELDGYLECRAGCDREQRKHDLAGLRAFLALKKRVALKTTIDLVSWCVTHDGFGALEQEMLDPTCEGGLFALGLFEDPSSDRSILASFRRFLVQRASPRERSALKSLFYPRYNGVAWFSGRPLSRHWLVLVERLDRKYGLYTREQWGLIRSRFEAPPDKLIREEFLFPPFHIARRLRSVGKDE
jgi:hypothetical protein